MARRVILVRHGDDPPDDLAYLWFEANGFDPLVVRPFAGETLPNDTGGIAGCVIYGGRYPAYETAEHPFLLKEYDWIDRCIRDDVPLLGICQGAQMLAWRFGAEVGPAPEGWSEFGWYEVVPTEAGRDFLPGPIHLAQFHSHGFSIPHGAEHLASSSLFPNQAFRLGRRIYGLQFHPEVTATAFRRWQDAPRTSFDRPGVQSREEQDRLIALHEAGQADWFRGFLRRLFRDGG